MKVLIIDNGSRHTAEIVRRFKGQDVEIVGVHWVHFEDIEPGTLVVMTGGRAKSVRHSDYYQRELDIIRYYEGPIVGICLGFQLIAKAFGAKIVALPHRIQRIAKVTPTPEGEAVFGADPFKAYEAHRWKVTSVPASLKVLANSTVGVEAIMHKKRKIIGVQFHPEVKSDEIDDMFKQVFLAVLR